MTARQQLAQELDEPVLAVLLDSGEGHPEEVEFDARAATDDLEVVVEDRVRIAVADDDPGRVEALLLEDAELGQANRGQDRMGRDRQAGAASRRGRLHDGPVPPPLRPTACRCRSRR